jgi:leader peptidase (prepilin peptidase)/N-methyltransferase
MNALVSVWLFILGTIIGSFLNVVIYRLNTGRSINGRSHCLSCGTILAWYELVPVVSYIAQKGRCRHCVARITPRYLAVELLTGALFLVIWQVFSSDIALVFLNLGIGALLVIILVYDIRHTIIPDTLVMYLCIFALVYILHDTTLWTASTVLGGLIPAVFFGGLWLVSRGRWMGLGDAKLAVPLGLIVGLWGSISMLILAFWVGAVVSVLFLILQKVPKIGFLFLGRRLTMKSEVPFAPFLICAFFLVQLMGVDVLGLFGAVFQCQRHRR